MRENNIFSINYRNKKRKLWLHGFLFAVFIIVFLLFLFCFTVKSDEHKQIEVPDCNKIIPYLQHGDIILRSGVGFWSELFRESNKLDKRFSHVGIIQKAADGKFLVLHAEADDYSGKGTVRTESLESFVSASSAIGISRLKKGDPEKFFQSAMKESGKPFDWKFDKDDGSEIYCTELVDLALKHSGIASGLKISGGLFLPESCLDPEYFREIIPDSPCDKIKTPTAE